MSTTVLGLTTFTGPAPLSRADWNRVAYSVDNGNRVLAAVLNKGVVSGWQLSTTKSTVTSGAGVVGGLYGRTTASQVISGLANGRNYIFARLDGTTATSQTIDFVSRTTSAAITNPDGVTQATRLGFLQRTAGAVSGVTNSGNAGFPRDKLFTISANKAVLPGGAKLWASGATTVRTNGLVTSGALRALGAIYASTTGSGITENRNVIDGLRLSGAVTEYRTRQLTINRGIIISTATTSAWTNVT